MSIAFSAAAGAGSSAAMEPTPLSKPKLYDMPVSNNGARIRMQLYARGWAHKVDVVPPMELGGLKTPEYLAINPLGKMPTLLLPDGNSVIESEVIQQYLSSTLADSNDDSVSLLPRGSDPLSMAKMNELIRLHDVYFSHDQGAMYRAMDVELRAEKIASIANLITTLETLVSRSEGPFLLGSELTFADCTWFPSFIFMTFILPRYFGWADVFADKPRLAIWWAATNAHPAGEKVFGEVSGGLKKWEESGRWDKVGIVEQLKSTDLQFAY